MFYLYAIIASLCVGVFLFIGVSDKMRKKMKWESYDPIDVFIGVLFVSLIFAAVWPVSLLAISGYFLMKKIESRFYNSNNY